jgi:transcriptional antiterminator RfaH
LTPAIQTYKIENKVADSIAWYAIRTRFKSEKVVAKQLEKKEIEYYLPLQKIVRVWGRRKQIIEKPFFNNYIFVNITPKNKVKVLETEHVLGFVQIGKDLSSIPNYEIETIKWVLGECNEAVLIEKELRIGDKVEIIAGGLTGLKGKLVELKGKKTFIIDLEELGKGIMIEVDNLSIKKL